MHATLEDNDAEDSVAAHVEQYCLLTEDCACNHQPSVT